MPVGLKAASHGTFPTLAPAALVSVHEGYSSAPPHEDLVVFASRPLPAHQTPAV